MGGSIRAVSKVQGPKSKVSFTFRAKILGETLDLGLDLLWTLDFGLWTYLPDRVDKIRQQSIRSALQVGPVRSNREAGHHVEFKMNGE